MKAFFSGLGTKKLVGIILGILAVIALLVIVGVKAGIGKAFLVAFLIAVVVGLVITLRVYGSNTKIKAACIVGLVVVGLIFLSVLFGAGRIFGTVLLLLFIAIIAIALIMMWRKGWFPKVVRIIATIVGIILILLLIVSMFGNLFKGVGKGGAGVLNGNTSSIATIDNTADETDNGIAITVYDSKSTAESNPYSSELVGYSLLAIVDDSESAKVTVEGTKSGTSGSAASDNWFGNMTTGSTYTVAYDSTNGGVEWFVLDSNQFEDGEIVLVTIETSAKKGFISQKFSQQTNNTSVYYWAFTAKHGDNTGTAPVQEENQDNSSAANTENTEGSYVAGNPGNTVVNQNNGTVGYVVFGDQPYGTYASFNEAWNNAVALKTSVANLTCIPFGTTQSINVTVHEGEANPSITALFLGARTSWSGNLDLSGCAGKTVVLKLIYANGEVLAAHDTQYVGFTVPAN